MNDFSWYAFGTSLGISLSLIAQIGEQADYLRFMPNKTKNNHLKWRIASIFADLVINKPLKLSPSIIEFKRAHLFNINPVGSLSTLIASILAIVAFSGSFGPE